MENWKKILVPAAVALISTAATALLMNQCETPEVVTRVVTQRIEIPADTVRTPGRIIYKPVQADTSAHRRSLDTIAVLRARLDEALCLLAAHEQPSASASIVQQRPALLLQGSDTTHSFFEDRSHIDYEFPPKNEFRLRHEPAVIQLPEDSTHIVVKEVAPPKTTWDYVLEGLKIAAGVVVGYLANSN